ncbi:unnamed protein product [Symbiodinium sp. CCMP2592]|nr:unnamed protein product [Symbiodinium sp. CCMP2592]
MWALLRFGLSTTVANERLVEQIEAVVGEFLELVKVVTWRARLSFLQTQEGAIAPLVVLALVVFAVLTGDTWLVGEVLLILPFHLLAWSTITPGADPSELRETLEITSDETLPCERYISFRLPRAEQLRAIAKVQLLVFSCIVALEPSAQIFPFLSNVHFCVAECSRVPSLFA